MFKRSAGMILAIVAIALVVSACGGGSSTSSRSSTGSTATTSSSASTSTASGPVVVELKNVQFQPKEIRVKAGQTVVFKNTDSVRHNVVQTTTDKAMSGPFGFESPMLQPGNSWEYTPTEKGEFPILCNTDGHYLAGMTGTLIVE